MFFVLALSASDTNVGLIAGVAASVVALLIIATVVVVVLVKR